MRIGYTKKASNCMVLLLTDQQLIEFEKSSSMCLRADNVERTFSGQHQTVPFAPPLCDFVGQRVPAFSLFGEVL
jgi:hypothetical protein